MTCEHGDVDVFYWEYALLFILKRLKNYKHSSQVLFLS